MATDAEEIERMDQLVGPSTITAILSEREYQEQKYPDSRHSVGEWILVMRKCLRDAEVAWQAGGPDADHNAIAEIRQVVASGCEAMNQCGAPVRPPYKAAS